MCAPHLRLQFTSVSWSHVAACASLSFCPGAFEGPTEAPLSTRHCKKRPSSPFSTSSSHLKLESLTTRITGQGISACVCERDTLPHSMRGICAIKAMSSASGCSPFSVHEDRGPTGGSTSAAALGMMMLELSVTLVTGRLPSHENWKFLKARPSGSVTNRVAEIIL